MGPCAEWGSSVQERGGCMRYGQISGLLPSRAKKIERVVVYNLYNMERLAVDKRVYKCQKYISENPLISGIVQGYEWVHSYQTHPQKVSPEAPDWRIRLKWPFWETTTDCQVGVSSPMGILCGFFLSHNGYLLDFLSVMHWRKHVTFLDSQGWDPGLFCCSWYFLCSGDGRNCWVPHCLSGCSLDVTGLL